LKRKTARVGQHKTGLQLVFTIAPILARSTRKRSISNKRGKKVQGGEKGAGVGDLLKRLPGSRKTQRRNLPRTWGAREAALGNGLKLAGGKHTLTSLHKGEDIGAWHASGSTFVPTERNMGG